MKVEFLICKLVFLIEQLKATSNALEKIKYEDNSYCEIQKNKKNKDKWENLKNKVLCVRSVLPKPLVTININKRKKYKRSAAYSDAELKKVDREQIKALIISLNTRNGVYNSFIEIITRLLFSRNDYQKLFTVYIQKLISKNGLKIENQEMSNDKSRSAYKELIDYVLDYINETKEELLLKNRQKEENLKNNELATSTSCKPFADDLTIQRINYISKDKLNVFKTQYLKVFGINMKTKSTFLAFVQLINALGFLNELFSPHFNKIYEEHLSVPPPILKKVHPYITSVAVNHKHFLIYYIMDWILYVVFTDNLMKFNITLSMVSPDGYLVTGLIYAIIAMTCDQKAFLIFKDKKFIEAWANKLSAVIISDLKHGGLYTLLDNIVEILNIKEIRSDIKKKRAKCSETKGCNNLCDLHTQLDIEVYQLCKYFYFTTQISFINVWDKQ